MATSTKTKNETETPAAAETLKEPLALSVVPEAKKPFTFNFSIARNIPIPDKAATRKIGVAHAFVGEFDRMGHNDSLFIPTEYWTSRDGIKPENAVKPSWQKQTIGGLYNVWRKKEEARAKLRLVTMERDPTSNPDPEFPAMAGVRCWVVDTTR